MIKLKKTISLISKYRQPDYKINQIFYQRWSGRAISGQDIPLAKLMLLFEAARWAPSANNNQPWRFVYADEKSRYWQPFFDLLNDGNKIWVKNASVLVIVVSKKIADYQNKSIASHSFDTGAVWQNLALQGSSLGLVVHAMAGFDYQQAKKMLKLDNNYQVEAMITIGQKGKVNQLPDYLQKVEYPSGRKQLSEIIFKGKIK